VVIDIPAATRALPIEVLGSINRAAATRRAPTAHCDTSKS